VLKLRLEPVPFFSASIKMLFELKREYFTPKSEENKLI